MSPDYFHCEKNPSNPNYSRILQKFKLIEEGKSKREELSLQLELEPDFGVKYCGTNPSKELVEQNTPKS